MSKGERIAIALMAAAAAACFMVAAWPERTVEPVRVERPAR